MLTGAIAAGCGFVIVKAIADAVAQWRAKQAVDRAKVGFAVFGGALGLAGVYIYWREVLTAAKATITFARQGTDYELLSPKMLGLALLAPFFFWMIGRSLADLPLPQRILSVVLRMAFVALLALGLSRLARTATTQKVATVYLVDVSESVPDAAVEDARAEITKALKEKPEDAIVRVITFARRPRVVPIADDAKEAPALERHDLAPTDAKGNPNKGRTGLGAATDVASAMQLAYGQYPAGYLRRAVIFTDGVQTDGDMLAEANRAKEFGVKVYTVPYHRPVPGEVALRDLRLPDKVRVGEPFNLHANIFSSRPQKVRATLKQGEAINGLDGIRDIELKAGDNDVTFKSVVRVAGEVTYALDLADIPEDRFKENNRFAVSVAVPGRPSVLYAEGNTSRASYLASALSAQEFDVDVRSPREIPSSIRELERYDFVILSDTPAESVSLTQQDAIESYVRDLGGGFLFAGGEAGFGLGGWYHTTVERILPVRMDSEKKRDEPQVAMVLVLDRSGSMSGLPIEMAKAAAKATADTLSSDDLIEVIAFDSAPTRVVRMTAAKHRARIQSDIARIQPGGGTEIFSALDAAYQSLTSTRARRKHVILLTDGQAPHNGIRDLAQAMAAENISVTSVGLGSGIDEGLLRMISDAGGGRLYKVMDPQQLPRVFTRETEMVSRNAAVEEYFQPRVVSPADFLRGVDMSSAPYLHGYVATKMKPPPAQEILQSEVQEPILARWHVGLGWSLAWTSDVKNLWAVEWLRWPGYGQFWGQLVREHMRQKKRQQYDMSCAIDPATGHVKASIDAIGGDDRFQNGLDAKLTVTGPQPNGETKKITMRQTAPGRYESDFPLERFGSFLLHASLEKGVEDGKGGTKSVQVAESFGHVTNPYPREYLALAPDVTTLSRVALVTGGRMDPAPKDVFDPQGESIKYHQDLWSRFIGAAVAVYLLDLLIRRVRIFDRKKTARPPVSRRPVSV
ncbi:MAG: VWA domain-containing protein [Labilithrix sp.]|nr:VWA domain-containing protein [Labilithrix sp.]MCW5813732.1 VWA domain-containing protein [Labilithrix sp.]